ncbi:MAG: hypothetical protein WEC59_09195 [Salibacteraceae bacterium]
MIRSIVSIIMFSMMVACSGENTKKEQPSTQSMIRNVPTDDRAFLLKPLEAALDDVREITDKNSELFESEEQIDSSGRKSRMQYALDEADTVKVVLEIERPGKVEKHWRYWDKDNVLYLMETRITYLNDKGEADDQRAYRVYLEANRGVISAYSKSAFEGKELSEEWRSTSLSPEELDYLLGQTHY